MSETQVSTEAQVDIIDDLDAFSTDFFGEKKVEPDAKPVAEQDEDQPEAAEGETEAQTEDPSDTEQETEAESEETPEVEKPKKKSVQDRIDELVRQREDVKRESEAKLQQLREEFEAKIAALKPTAPEAAKAAVDGEPTPDDLNEDGTPKYSLGEFDPQYVRDLTKFAFAQERAKIEAETAEAAQKAQEAQVQQAMVSEWNGKVEVAKVTYPDFAEKAGEMLNSLNDVPEPLARYLSGVLMSMDHGTDVLYYLSNHPDEAVKIVNSGAQKATLALGRIEAKFVEADAQKQVAKPKVSKAPPPSPVQARGTNGAFVAVAPDTDDLDAFQSEFFKTSKRK
jgi:hypothetical protein